MKRIALISTGGTIEKTYDEMSGVLDNKSTDQTAHKWLVTDDQHVAAPVLDLFGESAGRVVWSDPDGILDRCVERDRGAQNLGSVAGA